MWLLHSVLLQCASGWQVGTTLMSLTEFCLIYDPPLGVTIGRRNVLQRQKRSQEFMEVINCCILGAPSDSKQIVCVLLLNVSLQFTPQKQTYCNSLCLYLSLQFTPRNAAHFSNQIDYVCFVIVRFIALHAKDANILQFTVLVSLFAIYALQCSALHHAATRCNTLYLFLPSQFTFSSLLSLPNFTVGLSEYVCAVVQRNITSECSVFNMCWHTYTSVCIYITIYLCVYLQ